MKFIGWHQYVFQLLKNFIIPLYFFTFGEMGGFAALKLDVLYGTKRALDTFEYEAL